jgi:hypothetical protein
MAGSFTDYAEAKILDFLFKGTGSPWTAPTFYVALFTGTLSGDTPGTEVTGGSYARKATVAADWNAAVTNSTNKRVDNANALGFPAPTADWGGGSPVTHVGLMDASSGGNAYIYADLATPRTILNGDGAPSFAAGALTFDLG